MARNAAKEDTLLVILDHPCSIMIRQHAMQTECILEIFSPPESMVSHIDTTNLLCLNLSLRPIALLPGLQSSRSLRLSRLTLEYGIRDFLDSRDWLPCANELNDFAERGRIRRNRLGRHGSLLTGKRE